MLAPGLSTLFLPALIFIIEDLDASEELAALTISIYLGVTGVFPLVWGVLIDRLGRKKILLISLSFSILTCIGCSFAWNIYALIALRTIQALGKKNQKKKNNLKIPIHHFNKPIPKIKDYVHLGLLVNIFFFLHYFSFNL